MSMKGLMEPMKYDIENNKQNQTQSSNNIFSQVYSFMY